MKIRSVVANNRRKSFEAKIGRRTLYFPYSRLEVQPTTSNPVREVFVDEELGREGFTYVLRDGRQDTIHVDAVLDYNSDPAYIRQALLYKLTLEAQRALESSDLPAREVIRRLGTSASQFYRLIDQTDYRKSLGQLIELLGVLGCEVNVLVKQRAS